MAVLKALTIARRDLETAKVVRWRCVDLREEVARRFSVTVTEGTIGKWLRKMDLTRLQPRPYHPKKDADAGEAFKKTSPAWRKPRCPAAPPSPVSRSGYGTRTRPA